MDLYAKSCARRRHMLHAVLPHIAEWKIDTGWYLVHFLVFSITALLFDSISTVVALVACMGINSALNAMWPVFMIEDELTSTCLMIIFLMVGLELSVFLLFGLRHPLFLILAFAPHAGLIVFDVYVNVRFYDRMQENKNI